MLVLTRKKNEAILIGNDINVIVLDVDRGRVKIGITAPDNTKILRKELTKHESSTCHT